MGYKKGPAAYMKSPMKNKSCAYMAEGSAAYMSALHQVDPKEGVVVTGKDKSMSAGEARAKRLAAKKEEIAKKKEMQRIALENKRMERQFERETRRAAAGAKRQRLEQELKKKRGQISGDAQDTSTNYMRGPLNQIDPKDGSLISRDTQQRLDAMGDFASKKLAETALSKGFKSDAYKDKTKTYPGLKPMKQSKSYGERQIEDAMKNVTYSGTDQKISRGDAQIRQMFDPVRTQYEEFESKFGKGATPAKPFISPDYSKGITEKDVETRRQMNYAVTQPTTIKTKGAIKPTAQQLGGYRTRKTLATETPKMASKEKASFVKGDSEIRVMAGATRGNVGDYSSYRRSATTGKLTDKTKQRKRRTGKVFGTPQDYKQLIKGGRGEYVLKGTNPYLPKN